MRHILASMRAFDAGTGRSLCLFHRLALVAVALLLFQELSLCSNDYPGVCNKSPTGKHVMMRNQVPVVVHCKGGCGVTETRKFEWNWCSFCETTECVATLHKYAGDIHGCMCRKIRRSRDGDVYFDMTGTWKSNNSSKKYSNGKACCIL